MTSPLTPPPRVAIVSRAAHGGHPRYCAELATALAEAGAEVSLVEPAAGYDSASSVHDGIEAVSNAPISGPEGGWLRQEVDIAKTLLMQRKSGGIVVFQDSSVIRALLVAALRFGTGWSPVTMVHNTRPHNQTRKERFKHRLSMAALAVPHRVLTHNARQRSELDALPFVAAERIELVPHGMWTTNLADSSIESSPWNRVLMFGVMRDNSGLDEVLKIAPDLDREFPELHLDIVGKPATPNAARLLRELDAFDTIHVRSEFVSEEVAADLFASAHTTLLPYAADYTSESGVFVTALSSGHAIITTDSSSIADRVREFSLGPEPRRALLETFRVALAADDEQRETWSKNASNARRHFSWDEHARILLG